MPSTTFAGKLLTPGGESLGNALIAFVAVRTSPTVVEGVTSEFRTAADGTYAITVEYGRYDIMVRPERARSFSRVAKDVILNRDTIEEDLNALIITNQADWDITPEIVIEFRALREDVRAERDHVDAQRAHVDNQAEFVDQRANDSASSASAAKASEEAAHASEDAAADSEDLSRRWSEEVYGTEVVPGRYSSLHYSTVADNHRAAALQSAVNSADSAAASLASENASAASEAAAKASENAAAASEAAAKASEDAASGSESAAAASEAAAKASENASAASEAAAKTSETKAKNSESAAKASENAAAASEAASLASENAASDSESAAAASEAASKASEIASASSQAAAKASENKSRDWSMSGSKVDGVYYGARKYALDSKSSADDAQASEDAASASESKAKASEIAAASSESAAKASENAAAASESASKASENAAASSESAAADSAAFADQRATDSNSSSVAAKASEIAAASSEAAAKASENAAAASAITAEDWATKTSAPVEGDLYGAKYYAERARQEAISAMQYRGGWDASTGAYPEATRQGDIFRVDVAGTVNGVEYKVRDQIIRNEDGGWDHIDNTESVTSIDGYVGDITPVQLRAALRKVDGPNSGLGADTLDGLHATSFVRTDQSSTIDGQLTIENETHDVSALSLIQRKNETDAPAALMIATDGEASDIAIEVRSNPGGTAVDTSHHDYLNPSPDRKLYIMADGDVDTVGRVTAESFDGDGSRLDNLDADHLSTGTVPAARMPKATESQAKAGTSDVWPDAAGVMSAIRQFGLGGSGVRVSETGDAEISNADDIKKAGFYALYGTARGTFPGQASGDSLIHNSWGYGHQSQIGIGQNNEMFFRFENDYEWRPWNKLWHDHNMGSGSGLDADTVDGLHASDFAPHDLLDGGFSVTGIHGNAYHFEASVEGTPGLILRAGSNPESGESLFEVRSEGNSPRLRVEHSGLITTSNDDIMVRTDDSGVGGYKVWHQGNDGSGSGLDADKLDGLHATSFLRTDEGGSFAGDLTSAGGDIVFTETAGNGIYFGGAKSGSAYGYVREGSKGQLAFGSDNSVEFFETDNEELCVSWSLNSKTYNFTGTLMEDGHPVWHSGNDGAGSGLDADTVDGLHASDLMTKSAGGVISGKVLLAGDGHYKSQNPSIALAFGDSDTGFSWIEDGNFHIMANAQTVVDVTRDIFDVKKALRQNGHQVWHDGNALSKIAGQTAVDMQEAHLGGASDDGLNSLQVKGGTRTDTLAAGTVDSPQESIDTNGNIRVRDEGQLQLGEFAVQFNASTKSLDFNFTGA